MNVIFTCGGTAGHVNPALALAGFLRERDPKTRILFVGAERGLERDLIAHTPYPFRTVNIRPSTAPFGRRSCAITSSPCAI